MRIRDRKRLDMAAIPPQLDMLLKNLQATGYDPSGDWELVRKIIPNVTTSMCQQRYAELSRSPVTPHSPSSSSCFGGGSEIVKKLVQESLGLLDHTGPASGPNVDDELWSNAVFRMPRSKSDMTECHHHSNSRKSQTIKHGPSMVIHVCDEAKNVKQDFSCPRDLLIQEMKYFAEYLSVDSQRWEEIDISVHCDVQIFDWLMKYTKRTTQPEKAHQQKLEPTNVVSILISSDFLKMDGLVEDCIKFCHKNMSAVIAAPSNMNCINDRLLNRIADKLSHNEIEELRDRKDKILSKLFAKKVIRLFDPKYTNPDSPGNAVTLYKCTACDKLLTYDLECRLPCLPDRMCINAHGNITYSHISDPQWNVNDFLVDLHMKCKSWRKIYWCLWGTVNYQTCVRCQEVFQLCHLSECLYHPQCPVFSSDQYVGTFPCCEQVTVRFNPRLTNAGCSRRDHVISVGQSNAGRLVGDLLAHRDLVTSLSSHATPAAASDQAAGTIFPVQSDLYLNENLLKSEPNIAFSNISDQKPVPPSSLSSAASGQGGCETPDDYLGESDEDGSYLRPLQHHRQIRVQGRVPPADLHDMGSLRTSGHRWDSMRSLRFNQDCQREADLKHITELVQRLIRLRLCGEEKQRDNFSGGLFTRIDIQFRKQTEQQIQLHTSGSSRTMFIRDSRIKTRPLQPKT